MGSMGCQVRQRKMSKDGYRLTGVELTLNRPNKRRQIKCAREGEVAKGGARVTRGVEKRGLGLVTSILSKVRSLRRCTGDDELSSRNCKGPREQKGFLGGDPDN